MRRSTHELENKQLLQHATINAPKHAPISRRSFLGSVAVASLGAAVDTTVSLFTTVSSGVLPTVLAQGAPTPSGAAQTQGHSLLIILARTKVWSFLANGRGS